MDKGVLPFMAGGALSLVSLGLLECSYAPEWVAWSATVAAVGLWGVGVHQSHKD